ncbi:arylmalonate decarboxylase [Variovorax beijingensis]|jgi:arylmalonate decarboxylase|uniref:Arylmalonate decarboxylase n=1 Tax=Variovorax beijingensis TaxID=2496117 RepID=A0A3P3EYZ9_9BURK|nr:aspartate/glutamate racemase family protein [Variovorax beijingensis]RRH91531.1 arylmalonate decarboxylase [Variovorax beijingensis]RSZ44796.1 arylmalonate decarboxylase [Variovorax beijingensis]
MALPHLGLIVPPAAGAVPVDGPLLYGERIRFSALGLGLGEISTRGYTEVIDSVVEKAVALKARGAVAVSLMGTSLSFFRGAAFNRQLEVEMARATGLPCTTMSNAIVGALRQLGVRRVAVATAYIDEVNAHLRRYLEQSDFEPLALEGLAISDVQAVGRVPTQVLIELCLRVFDAQPGADGILISCGGLVTLDAVREVEARLQLPVVSSSPAGFWDLVRTAGLDARSPGQGRLFAEA